MRHVAHPVAPVLSCALCLACRIRCVFPLPRSCLVYSPSASLSMTFVAHHWCCESGSNKPLSVIRQVSYPAAECALNISLLRFNIASAFSRSFLSAWRSDDLRGVTHAAVELVLRVARTLIVVKDTFYRSLSTPQNQRKLTRNTLSLSGLWQ